MDQKANGGSHWTVARVETRLIAAFRSLPNHPVYSVAGGIRVTGDHEASEALAWARRYVADRLDRLTLLSWARCRATQASFAAVCHEMGWTRSTAEHLRRRAAAAIVAALNGDAQAS